MDKTTTVCLNSSECFQLPYEHIRFNKMLSVSGFCPVKEVQVVNTIVLVDESSHCVSIFPLCWVIKRVEVK